ncbi:MAG TPA: CAP domain-containing protein [Telluria sp.]
MRFCLLLPALGCAALPAMAAPPDPLIGLINAYRATPTGCDGRPAPGLAPLSAPPALSRVRAGRGILLDVALERAGYAAREADAIAVSGSADPVTVMGMIEQRYCKTLRSSRFSAVGVVHSGVEWLIVLAQPAPPPPASLLPSQEVAGRLILAAVNRARASERKCGTRFFTAAAPMTWNAALADAALLHSADMAAQHYLNHTGKDGRTAAERALAAGYRWRRIGENIAAGQDTPEEVVQGWLDSPGHCINIMSEDLTEMGAAYAVNSGREPARIYWTQVLATPR